MLAQSNAIRDVSRALPVLVSGPDLGLPVSAERLEVHAEGLRQRYDSLCPVIDRAGSVLSEAMKLHDPQLPADPDGEGVRAMEQGERYFKHRLKDLQRLRSTFTELRVSPSHDVFGELDRLEQLYAWIVATFQEVRWSVLIFDGIRDSADAPERRALTSSSEWLASLHDE